MPTQLQPRHPVLPKRNSGEVSEIDPTEFVANNKKRRANQPIPVYSPYEKDEPDIQEIPAPNQAAGAGRLDHIPHCVTPSTTSQSTNFRHNGIGVRQAKGAQR